jgi:hypothetical protein
LRKKIFKLPCFTPLITWVTTTHAIGDDFVWRLDLTKPGAKPEKLADNVGWNNSSDFGDDGAAYGGANMYGGILRWDMKIGKPTVV